MDTKERVKAAISHLTGIDADKIGDRQFIRACSAEGGLDLDSLDAVELVMLIEEEFGIEIDDTTISKDAPLWPSDRGYGSTTVSDLVAIVEMKLAR